MYKLLFSLAIASMVLTASGGAHASETITYTYDTMGRLVKVVHTGTANNNLQTTYTQDKVDNRKNTTTTGSPN